MFFFQIFADLIHPAITVEHPVVHLHVAPLPGQPRPRRGHSHLEVAFKNGAIFFPRKKARAAFTQILRIYVSTRKKQKYMCRVKVFFDMYVMELDMY